MNKKLALFSVGIIIFIALIFSLLNFVSSPTKNSPQITPTPSQTQNNKTIFPLKTSIKNGEVNVPLTSSIVIDFDFPVDPSNFTVSMLPSVDVLLTARGNSLIITPKTPLKPSTIYSIVVSTIDRKTFVTSLYFTSFGPTPTLLPNTRPLGEPERTDAELRRTRPDIFLANHTPYQEETFSIVSTFVSAPTEHFSFNVTLKAEKNISKSNFLSWLRSLGLTETQAANIEIFYN